MTWLTSETSTWSLPAIWASGIVGCWEWIANASSRFGVATKFANVTAES
ncbi:MAG TPA: hypothetical protein VFL29_12645 [Candidatus Dormibacteraeota bacterium]|nr:hypothetical protein [Candidatus Dormibacteraeota bacterium]